MPGPTDHVCIPSAAPVADVRLSAATTVLSVESEKPIEIDGVLTLSDVTTESVFADVDLDSTIDGAGDRRIDGTMKWSGTIDGPGVTTAGSTSSVEIDSGGAGLDSVLHTDGAVSWFSSVPRVYMTNGTWEHAGTMTVGTGGVAWMSDTAGTNLFHVTPTGTITQTGNGGTFTVPVGNDGTITATDGLLRLGGAPAPGADPSTGTYAATGTGTLSLYTGVHAVDGAQITGTSTVEIFGDIDAVGPLTTTTGSVLDLTGDITGPGARQIDGTMKWSGTIDGPGVTTAGSTSTVEIDGSNVNLKGLLITDGAVTWPYSVPRVYMTNGTWEHAGTMTVGTGGVANMYDTAGTNLFHVTPTGTITQAGNGGTFTVPVGNDGTITATDGLLRLGGAPAPGADPSTGTYAATGTGTLSLYTGVHAVDGAQITGTSTVEIFGDIDAVGPLTTTTGSVLDLTGDITGPGARQIDGTMKWSGTIDGPGVTTAGSTSTVEIDGSNVNLKGLLITDGAVTWPYSVPRVYMTNGTWEHAGTMTVGTGGVANMYDTAGTNLFHVTPTGTITQAGNGGTFTVPVGNDGTITATDGLLQLDDVVGYDSVTDTLSGGSWAAIGTGILDLEHDSAAMPIAVADADLSVGGTGIIRDDNDGLDDLTTVTTNGGLAVRDGATITTPGPLTTAGAVRVGASSTLTTTGLYHQTSGSTVLEDPTATLTATGSRVEISGGSLTGVGTAGPEIRSTGSGVVAPGLSPGTLSSSGSAQLDGTLAVEIDGTTPGTDHDVLAAGGAVSVSGTLELTTDPGFDPALATTIDIVTGSSVTGAFSGVSGLSAGTGKGWDITYLATAVRATVVDVTGVDVVASAAAVGPAFNVGYGGAWTVDVANAGGAASSGAVTADLTLGAGQTLTSATGTGWSCSGTAPISCTHAGGIASGASLPAINVAVTVDGAATPATTLDVAVSGGGDSRPGNNSFTATVAASNLTPPQAFAAATTATTITAPDSVSFTGGNSTGDIDDYLWDFGDGSTGTGIAPIHTYTSSGIYIVSLRVENEVQFDIAAPVQITVLAFEPVMADAGDDRTVVLGQSTQFDGGDSTPGDITAFDWSFGDGQSDSGETVSHAYANPGIRTVTLTVTRGSETDVDTATVTVLPATGDALTVTVTDGSSVITGATVVVMDAFGVRYDATTDGTGDADIGGLVDGSYTAFVYAAGFLPAVGQATVTGGNGAVTIPLNPGAVGTTDVTSDRLTYSEIIAAGIDPNDPANQNVYEFTICLAFNGSVCSHTFEGIANEAGTLHGTPSFTGGTCVSNSCTTTAPDGRRITGSVSFHGGQPAGQFLMIPGEARWLKEFFEVQLLVQNLAPPGFTFEQGVARLDLPEGLALAPTSDPQDEAISLPDISGFGAETASWILRGDEAGLYPLTAEYSAFLDPVGASILLSASTAEPLQVWGADALEMTVTADDVAEAHDPYRVSITLTNVTDGSDDPAPVYNPVIELKAAGGANWIAQPNERFLQGTAEIVPGGSFTADFVLIPDLSGVLNLAGSFVYNTAEGPDLPDTIVSQPRELPTPALTATPDGGDVDLSWDPVAGAVDYVIYRTDTDLTPFAVPPTPLGTVSAPTTTFTVTPDGEEQWYAIGTVFADGVSLTKHPLVPVIVPVTILPSTNTQTEGDTVGPRLINVAVRLNYASSQTITVDWATDDSPTQPEAGVDYDSAGGTLTFNPGETLRYIPITIYPDEITEGTDLGSFFAEVVSIDLSNPVGAVLDTDTTADLKIKNDDNAVIRPYGTVVTEADTTVSIPVYLNEQLVAAEAPITVQWETVAGTADPRVSRAGEDFVADSGTLTFQPGEVIKHIDLTILEDTVDEPNLLYGEWAVIRFYDASGNASIDRGFFGLGLVIIIDDDP